MEYEDCHVLRLLEVPEDRLHRAAVVCGNKTRFKVFAEVGSNYREFGDYLCYKAAEVEMDGEMILLVCHGTSGSALALVVREMLEMGVKYIIRCGTCGTFKPRLVSPNGGVCIVYAAYRADGCSYSEVDPGYPSVADYDVVDCLVETSKELGFETHLGITLSADLYFTINANPSFGESFLLNTVADVSEAETSSLFVLSSLYGCHSGSILVSTGNILEALEHTRDPKPTGTEGNSVKYDEHVDKATKMAVEISLKAAAVLKKHL